MTTERLGYQPALDGVRAVAISLVVLFHYPWGIALWVHNPVHGGFLGVDAFFVLSGFLITTLLLQEHGKFGHVNLARFYARRALRLLPALGVLLVIAVVMHFALATTDDHRPQIIGLLGMVFYVANWVHIYRPMDLGIVADTWSLAVEEQFYLLWPIILILLLRRQLRLGTIAALTAAGIATAAIWRAWYWHTHLGHLNFVNFYLFATDRSVPTNAPGSASRRFAVWNRAYLGTDARADALLAGCLTAIVLFWLLPRLSPRARTRLSVASGVALVISAVIVSRAIVIVSDWLPEWGFVVFAICIAVVITGLVAAPHAPLSRAFALAPLAWLGRRSYAIYLFNQIVFFYCNRSRVHLSPQISFVFQILVILAVAELSYRLVEAPMLRRKRAFEPAASSLR